MKVYQTDGKHDLVRHSLAHFLDQLPADLFIQTQRGFVVNLSHVTEVNKQCLYLDEYSIPVSRSRWDQVIKAVQVFGIS